MNRFRILAGAALETLGARLIAAGRRIGYRARTAEELKELHREVERLRRRAAQAMTHRKDAPS
jgi:hypothetical protein